MKKTSFTKLVSGLIAGKASQAQMWRPLDQPYPRLLDLDPAALGLSSQDGIYAVWHLGVRPQWLRVGAASNLAAALSQLAHTSWIIAHKDNQGVFVAWAFPPQNQSTGLIRYLAETLSPAFQTEPFPEDRAFDPAVRPIECLLPPGTQS